MPAHMRPHNPGRKRFMDVFAGRRPDRVPFYEQAVSSSVASALLGRPAYANCMGLGRDAAEAWLRGQQAHDDFVAKLVADWTALADLLDADAIVGPSGGARPTRKLDEHNYLYGDPDGRWQICRFAPETETFGPVKGNYRPRTLEELEADIVAAEAALDKAAPPTPEAYPVLAMIIEHNAHKRAIVTGVNIAIPMAETWMIAVALRPDLIDRHLALTVEQARRTAPLFKAMGVDVIFGGGDLADKNGCIYGPQVFHDHLLPHLQQFVKIFHDQGLPYVFRTDGNLWSIADDLFGASGVDGYGEIDQEAGMDLGQMRERFPQLTMWGGVACGPTLRNATPQQVKAEALRSIEGASSGGGLILGSSNTIMHGTPPENVWALLEARDEFSTSTLPNA